MSLPRRWVALWLLAWLVAVPAWAQQQAAGPVVVLATSLVSPARVARLQAAAQQAVHHIADRDAVQDDATARRLAAFTEQSGEGGFARARLAHQRHGALGRHHQGYAVDRNDATQAAALAEPEGHAQVFEGEQRRHGARLRRRGERVARPGRAAVERLLGGRHASTPRSFGSSASRRVSVSSENAVTNTAMKAVAVASCHQWPRINSLCASPSIVPQET